MKEGDSKNQCRASTLFSRVLVEWGEMHDSAEPIVEEVWKKALEQQGK